MYRVELDEGTFEQQFEIETDVSENSCACPQEEELQEDDQSQQCDRCHHVYFERCEDAKCCDLGDTVIESQGRLLDVKTTVKNVCPGKRIAVAIVVHELDSNNMAHHRGTKILTLPAHSHPTCKDIAVESTRFVLPEDVAVTPSCSTCNNRRHFIVRIDAHYMDMTGCFCSIC